MRAFGNKERRKYFRHPVQVPIVCRRGDHMDPQPGGLRDIGYGGMAFVSASRFEPGDIVTVEYPTLDMQGMAGEITWSVMMGDEAHRHSYGLRFLDCRAFTRARLLEQLCRIEIYRHAQCDEYGRQLSRNEAAREWIGKTASHFPH